MLNKVADASLVTRNAEILEQRSHLLVRSISSWLIIKNRLTSFEWLKVLRRHKFGCNKLRRSLYILPDCSAYRVVAGIRQGRERLATQKCFENCFDITPPGPPASSKLFSVAWGSYSEDQATNSSPSEMHKRMIKLLEGTPGIHACGYQQKQKWERAIGETADPSVCASFHAITVPKPRRF